MLFRRSLTNATLTLSASLVALAGCAKDLELDPPVDPSSVVVAQFDPTNPIPVLQLIPSPTILAQDPATGKLLDDPDRPGKKVVEPEDCELPTSAQCLAFVDGWPTTTPISLYFSGALDESEATIKSGIHLYEVGATGALTELDYNFRIGARDPVNANCRAVYNYTADQEPPGIQVQLSATTPLKPATQYVVMVESHADGGLRSADGKPVEAQALVSFMNVDEDPADPSDDPVLEDGTIQNALLRSNVQGAVLRGLFPGKSSEELTAAERTQLAAAVQGSGVSLRGLFSFFDGVIDLIMANQIVDDRKKIILTNTWITDGPAATTVAFDPANSVVPFPNSQLLTTGDLADPASLSVNIPISADASPTEAALIGGLNTLNGFSTLAPMTVSFTGDIDAASLDGNVLLYRANGAMLDPMPHPISISTSSASESALAAITIQPLLPLQDNAHYVVVLKKGILDAGGREVGVQSTFNLLKTPVPLIDASETVFPAVVPALQCSFAATTGSLGSDPQVKGLATAIETAPEMGGLGHSKWLAALGLLTAQPVAIPGEEILFAWSYNTQDIRGLMTQVRDQLIPAWDTATPGPRLIGPVAQLVGTASIAGAINVVGNLCVPLCQSGEFEPDIDRNACGSTAAPSPAVASYPNCQLAVNLVAGDLERASLYIMRTYVATSGSPYIAGTFTPETLMTPAVTNLQVWVLEGSANAPAAGRPAAIVQHGLGQVKESGFLAANRMSTVNTTGGWATILMDLPFHGSRANDLIDNATGAPCNTDGIPNVDPGAVTCDPQTGMCVGGCDGVQDPSGTGFLSSNVFGARDNFRQSLIDHLVLVRTLELESQAGGALEGIIDGTQIGYLGQSLGGITGGNLMAFAPDSVQAGVLNVAGGGLTTILLNTVPAIAAPLFVALNRAGVCEFNVENDPTSGCKDSPAFRQFLLIAQTALDPGDPLATSIGVRASFGPENVLMQMALPDPVVANAASFALAGSYGFLPAENNPLANHFQVYDFSAVPVPPGGSGCHGFLLTPISGPNLCGECLIDALCNTLGAQEQAATFLDTGAQTISAPRPMSVANIFPCDNPCQ